MQKEAETGGYNLGNKITKKHEKAIQDGTFDKLPPGSYFISNNVKYTVSGYNIYKDKTILDVKNL